MMIVNRSRKIRGQAVTEFALVFPVLLLLVFGVIEFGRFVLAYDAVNNAAREGARFAIVHGADSDCPSGPMPGGISLAGCADPKGIEVQRQVVKFGFTLALATSVPADPKVCSTPTANQIVACWPDLDNARGQRVTVLANASFKTIIPLPLPQISMMGRSTLVINH